MKSLYRKGVCGIFQSASGLILMGERAKQLGHWQLPQGGIEKGETPLQALRREMLEETGVRKVVLIKQTNEYLAYQWPEFLKKRGKILGQEHLYFLLDGSRIDLAELQATEEFAQFRWETIDRCLELIVEWKRDVYVKAFKELALIT